MMREFFKAESFGPFVNGEFIIDQKRLQPHKSIALKKEWKQLASASKQEIELAIDKSTHALEGTSEYERAAILMKMAQLLREYREPIAECITLEMGKTIRDAKAEVLYAANYFEWFGEEAKRIFGYEVPSRQNKNLVVRHQPIGTVAIITPWNFPIAMAARKIGPAIAAGCSSLVKPSSDTPISMLAIAQIAKEAGLPSGALAILPGDPDAISDQLLSDPRVRKLTFTGSTAIGEKLYGQCVSTFKKVTLELGGHAPVLIFEDANIERAVEETINAKLRVSGQTCVCANRIFVHRSLAEKYIQTLQEKISQLTIGDPLDESTDLTNVLHPSSEKKVPIQIKDALKKGAHCIFEGESPHHPTILTNITKEMEIFSEETFGPVFPIATFETEEEAIALANDTIYGLAAYVFTNDLSRAHRIIKALDYGIIGFNDGLPTTPEVPFGGMKYSGFGREGGPRGIYEYLIEKTISLKY